MNLKRYEEAADSFSKAIEFAPVAKQASLRDLRKQCALAESNPVPSSPAASPVSVSPSATQSEVVLWKSIESSTNRADYEGYLKQYPSGTFATLAQGRIEQITKDEDLRATREAAARQEALRQAGTDFGVCLHHLVLGGFQDNGCGRLNVHPGIVSFSDDKASDGFTASCSEVQQPTLQNSRFFTGKRYLLLIISGRKIAVEASQPSVLDNILQHIQSECPK
jgi:hypothetical protein